jgi:hypothetical protein
MNFARNRAILGAVATTALAACSGGGGSSPAAPVPTATPSSPPFIEFVPATISVRSSQFDYFGELTYSARTGLVPKPLSPAKGVLACNGGYSVVMQIHQGPAPIGVVHDQYLVLPLTANPPEGTTLSCTSTWGLYDASGALVAQAPLQATLIYDTGKPAIYFMPASLKIESSSGTAVATLAYISHAGLKDKPVTPGSGYLACAGGYSVKPQLRAGPALPGYIAVLYEIDPADVTPKPAKGATLDCTTTWGLADTAGNVVQVATLKVAITYDRTP